MDIDMVYFFLICAMTVVSLIGPIEYISGRVGKVGETTFPILFAINMIIPVFVYFIVYYYGMENYNNKRLFIGIMTLLYLISLISQYVVLVKSNKEKECHYLFSGTKYNNVKDSLYRFTYMIFMIIIPFYLNKSTLIMSWGLLAPVLIPIFLYISSFILGLGVSDGKKVIDSGDYYHAFIRGIDENENYVDDGLTLNILRSMTRSIILFILITISFLVSKKIASVDKTSPMSIFIFLIIISSILPILLGYFIEPKCLLKQAEKKSEGNSFKCYVFDKHGGVYTHIIYILVCGLIIISKDN